MQETPKRTFRLAAVAVLVGAGLVGTFATGHGAPARATSARLMSDTPTVTATVVAASTPTTSPTSTTMSPSSTSSPIPSATGTSMPATASTTATGTAATATTTPTPSSGGATADYFAEGYTGIAATNGRATFTETLNILNPSSVTAPITITYYIQGGLAPVVVSRTISPTTVLSESVNTDVGADKLVAAVVTSPQRVYATRTITRVSALGVHLDASTTQPVTAPGTSWGFPEGYTGVTFQEYLTVLNPTSNAATVSILLAPQASSATGARTLRFSVPALSRVTKNIRSLNEGNSAKSVGMIVTSDQPIVPERVLYFGDGAGSGKFGSTVRSGLTLNGGLTGQRFAIGSSGGVASTATGAVDSVGNQDFLTLLNPNSASVQAVAVFSDANGQQLGQPVVVNLAPNTRGTIVANTVIGSTAQATFSVALNSNLPLLAESAQYYGGSPNIGQHPGVDFQAQTGGATDVFLTDLSTQQTDGTAISRDLYLYNPGGTSIQVAATYFGGNGKTVATTYTIPAGSIQTVSPDQDSQASIPTGPLAVELKLVGTTGNFLAATVGRTNDNHSATEDVGFPAY